MKNFKLRSGNKTSFKSMGSKSPLKQDESFLESLISGPGGFWRTSAGKSLSNWWGSKEQQKAFQNYMDYGGAFDSDPFSTVNIHKVQLEGSIEKELEKGKTKDSTEIEHGSRTDDPD